MRRLVPRLQRLFVDGGNGNQHSRVIVMSRYPKENKQIGERLRYERTRKLMSLACLSDLVGVTYQQIQKYERGQDTLSVPMLKRIANALDISPSNILG